MPERESPYLICISPGTPHTNIGFTEMPPAIIGLGEQGDNSWCTLIYMNSLEAMNILTLCVPVYTSSLHGGVIHSSRLIVLVNLTVLSLASVWRC